MAPATMQLTTLEMKQPKKKIDYDRLNLIGKAVYLGGATFRFVSEGIDAVVDRAVDLYLDAEKAFKQGVDPNIEDAKILDERAADQNPDTSESAGDQNTPP